MTGVRSMNDCHRVAAAALAAVVCVAAQSAQASTTPAGAPVIATSAVHAQAQPLGQALPSFVFNFDADFDLIGFMVSFKYDETKLSFNAAASTLSVGGSTAPLSTVLAQLQAASTIPGPGPDFLYSPDGPGDFGSAIGSGLFTFTGVYQTQSYLIPAGSSVTMTGVFDLLQGFDAGTTPVQVYGEAFDVAFNNGAFDVTANVSAVPEPETWLMLLGGLGLLASRVRRRSH